MKGKIMAIEKYTIVKKNLAIPTWLAFKGCSDDFLGSERTANFYANSREQLAVEMGIDVTLIPEKPKISMSLYDLEEIEIPNRKR